jgi:hypothetical protein
MERKICLRCDETIEANDKTWINEEIEFAHDKCIGFDDLNEWKSFNFDYINSK